jgi:hypothetical protein
MRKVTAVRLGIAAGLAAMGAAGAVGSGCSSSTPVNNQPGVDSGPGQVDSGPCTGGTGCTVDSGIADSAVADSGPVVDSASPPPATLLLAHTAPGVPPFRVCFSIAFTPGQTASVQSFQALPDNPSVSPPYPATGPYPGVAYTTPGIYPGSVGPLPAFGIDYQNIPVTAYVILASSIANDVNIDGSANGGVNSADGGAEEDCPHLIGTHGLGTTVDTAAGAVTGRLVLGQDFFAMPTIPMGTLHDSTTYLITVNGCLPGGTPAGVPQECGADYDGGVTANLGIATLDTTTPGPDGGIGVQFAHRATAIENVPIVCPASVCGSVTPIHDPAAAGVYPVVLQEALVDGGEEAGLVQQTTAFPVSTTPILYSGNGISATAPVPVTPNGGTVFAVGVAPLDGGFPNELPWPGTPGAPGDVLAFPFSAIQLLSQWGQSTASAAGGAQFSAGVNYTFILVGDPAAAQLPTDGGLGQYDGRGVHFLAFPNVFTPLPAP